MLAVDLKKDSRRLKIYYLYSQGRTKAQIAEQLQISESTVDRDLEFISDQIAPNDWDSLRNETLNSLRGIKVLLLKAYDESSGKIWTQAKILSIMKDIDLKVLDKMSQPQIEKQLNVIQLKDDALRVASFLTSKHPEFIEEFRSFVKEEK